MNFKELNLKIGFRDMKNKNPFNCRLFLAFGQKLDLPKKVYKNYISGAKNSINCNEQQHE